MPLLVAGWHQSIQIWEKDYLSMQNQVLDGGKHANLQNQHQTFATNTTYHCCRKAHWHCIKRHAMACPTLPNKKQFLKPCRNSMPLSVWNLRKSVETCHLPTSFSPLRRPQVGLWHFGPESWSFWDGELLPVGLPWEPGCWGSAFSSSHDAAERTWDQFIKSSWLLYWKEQLSGLLSFLPLMRYLINVARSSLQILWKSHLVPSLVPVPCSPNRASTSITPCTNSIRRRQAAAKLLMVHPAESKSEWTMETARLALKQNIYSRV